MEMCTRLNLPLVLGALVLLALGDHTVSQSVLDVDNAITQWNAVTQRIVRALALPNQIAGRVYTEVHVPQYLALQSAYKRNISHPEAAAHYAAHFSLSFLFPWQQSPNFDGFLSSKINSLNLTEEEDYEAEKIGIHAATKFLDTRANDGSQRWAKFTPAPAGGPTGKYQFTPNQTFALYPQLASTRTEVIKSPEDFDTFGGPPQIPGSRYNSDYQTVATVGNANSPLQTQVHKDTARFWEDGGNTSGVIGHLFNATIAVTGSNLSLKDTAKLFAVIAVGHFDGAISGWYQKYKYLYWRPITALRQGDPSHAPLPSYETFLRTPAHPEYPSTHSVNGGVWAIVLAKYLGITVDEKIPSFSVATEGYLLPARTYTKLEVVATEIYLSRVYGGVHFPTAGKDGLHLGIDVGEYVFDHFDEVYGEL